MARDTSKPIGRIADSGYGCDRVAHKIDWFIQYEGPQAVFADEEGAVFAFPDGQSLALHWYARHPRWLVGLYCMRAPGSGERFSRMRCASDLRDQAVALRRAAA